MIVATHDAEFAAAFATRVVLLGDGLLVADATPREVLAGGLVLHHAGRARARRRLRGADPRAGRRRHHATGGGDMIEPGQPRTSGITGVAP